MSDFVEHIKILIDHDLLFEDDETLEWWGITPDQFSMQDIEEINEDFSVKFKDINGWIPSKYFTIKSLSVLREYKNVLDSPLYKTLKK